MALPQEQFGMGAPNQTQHSPMSLREQLMSLFPSMSLGKSSAFTQPQVPTRLRNGPMTDADVEAMVERDNGPMNDNDLAALLGTGVPNTPRPAPRPQAPQRDEVGMDELMMQLASPEYGITEGQNANIGDDSRARAMAQIAALRG